MDENSTLLVDVKGLNVYQDDKLILQNVNMHVDVGEFVYLIGKVGSGKSSLLKTLYCELPVVEGDVNVVGYDLKKIKNSGGHGYSICGGNSADKPNDEKMETLELDDSNH